MAEIEQTLLLSSNRIMSGLSIGIFTFDFDKFLVKVKVKVMHIFIANTSKVVIDTPNITIAVLHKVMYALSIGIFAFDLGSL